MPHAQEHDIDVFKGKVAGFAEHLRAQEAAADA